METENVKREWKSCDWKDFFFLNQKENHPVELTEDWLVYKKVSVNLKAIQ